MKLVMAKSGSEPWQLAPKFSPKPSSCMSEHV